MDRPHDRRQPAVVLVACDDEGGREVLARVVERSADVESALRSAATTLPRAVVVDLRRGGLGSALQLLDRLRSSDDDRVAGTHLVVIEDPGNGRTVLAAGADVHLSRPAHVADVSAAIGRASSTR